MMNCTTLITDIQPLNNQVYEICEHYLNRKRSNDEISSILWKIKQQSCSMSSNAADFLVA
jgi:hypothetical protein